MNFGWLKGLLICVFVVLSVCGEGWCDVDFDRLHGSDLGMGVGARAIAMAGAFTAVADDASALFWNPAGLTRLETDQLFLSMDMPCDFSSAAFVHQPKLEKLNNMGFTLGLGLINRLSFTGESGSDLWEGYAANLLDMAMIDIGDGFSGKIDSKTYDLRLSAAMKVGSSKKLSLGINLTHIS